MAEAPCITGVCVVTDPVNCPDGYLLIDRTHDRREDADLWIDRLFGRRVTRYLCISTNIPNNSYDVLVDVAVINEKDQVPVGFTCLEFTEDTRDKATKKKLLCVRWMSSTLTQDAICDLMFLSKNSKRPPGGYTLVGEINNLCLCYKMGPLTKTATNNTQPTGYGTQPPTYAMEQPINMNPLNAALPYALPGQQMSNSTLNRRGPPEQSSNSLAASAVNPVAGVPWHLNSKFDNSLQNVNIPEIRYKSMMDVENQYQYPFTLEKSAVQMHSTESS